MNNHTWYLQINSKYCYYEACKNAIIKDIWDYSLYCSWWSTWYIYLQNNNCQMLCYIDKCGEWLSTSGLVDLSKI